MTANTRKTTARQWSKEVDQDAVQQALEEACIDIDLIVEIQSVGEGHLVEEQVLGRELALVGDLIGLASIAVHVSVETTHGDHASESYRSCRRPRGRTPGGCAVGDAVT